MKFLDFNFISEKNNKKTVFLDEWIDHFGAIWELFQQQTLPKCWYFQNWLNHSPSPPPPIPRTLGWVSLGGGIVRV